jgi:hypothetical protein
MRALSVRLDLLVLGRNEALAEARIVEGAFDLRHVEAARLDLRDPLARRHETITHGNGGPPARSTGLLHERVVVEARQAADAGAGVGKRTRAVAAVEAGTMAFMEFFLISRRRGPHEERGVRSSGFVSGRKDVSRAKGSRGLPKEKRGQTLDARPAEQLSVRLELRRDASGRELYYRGQVAGTGEADAPYVPNARTQSTVLLGATAWF